MKALDVGHPERQLLTAESFFAINMLSTFQVGRML